MEKDIFWDVFRETGEPLCWLLSRMRERKKQGKTPDMLQEDRPSCRK